MCVLYVELLKRWRTCCHMICCWWHRWQLIWMISPSTCSSPESNLKSLSSTGTESIQANNVFRVLSTAFSGQADAGQTPQLSNNILTGPSKWLSVPQSEAGVWCEAAVTLNGRNLLLIWIMMMSRIEKQVQQIAHF